MKLAVLTLSAHGHVNPMLPLVAELSRRGHEIILPVTREFSAAAALTGARVIDLGDPVRPPVLAGTPDAAGPEAFAAVRAEMRDRTIQAIRAAVAAAPDLVIYDAFLAMTGDSTVYDLPMRRVAFFPTFAIPEGASPMEVLRIPESARTGLLGNQQGSPILNSPAVAEDLNIVAIPRSYQPHPEAFDGRYLFAGPMLRTEPNPADFPIPPADGRPLVFVSLGTVASDRPDFYRAALDALGSRGWRAVVATGRTDPDAIGPIPANVVAAPHVPQLAVLGEADVFVSHGGMNSTMES
ncbi:MAG: hypothetical protein ACR2J8_04340, partial [Thermomicrobiales bacterium]